jgi:CheY-like chemotaxis protein/two-component sensor histidine kinase
VAEIRHWGHDVRHALDGLIDHLRMIPAGSVPAEGQLHLRAALSSAESMAQMIATALEQFTGERAPSPGPLELRQLVRALDDIFTRPAAARGARLILRTDPALPRALRQDRMAVERILRSLIGNAIRHSGARQIVVEITMVTPGRLGLSVRDDGAGFPADLVAAADAALASPGLGLPVLARLTADLNGTWGIENPAGGGARAWVELPYTALPSAAPPPAAGEAPPAAAAAGIAGRVIMVVDSDAACLQLCARVFGGAGARLELCRSGEQAVALLPRVMPDLLVVDATMPGLSGAEVIRALRAQPGAQGATPALAMTADIAAPRHDELIAAGASRVVTKPLPPPAELLRIAERVILNTQRASAVAATPQPPNAPPVPPDPGEILFDPEPLRRLCALVDEETAQEILDRLVLDLSQTLDRIEAAGEPRTDGAEDGTAALRAATHVLIALSGTAGAMRLLHRTQALNLALHAGPVPDIAARIAEIRLLTRGAIVAITRLPWRAGVPESP